MKKICKFDKNEDMLTKEKLISSLSSMPEDDFRDIDTLLERIILLEKISNAEDNIQEGKTFTTEEVKQKLSKWL